MLAFGAAELPALATMSAHGAGVMGFELAGSTARMREILVRWGSVGVAAARQHVLIDLGFILGYGVLLVGVCGRLSTSFQARGSRRAAGIAAVMAWAAVSAAAFNTLQKVLLWLELHGHVAQPLPGLVAVCAAITFALAFSAALFAVCASLAARRPTPAEPLTGGM